LAPDPSAAGIPNSNSKVVTSPTLLIDASTVALADAGRDVAEA